MRVYLASKTRGPSWHARYQHAFKAGLASIGVSDVQVWEQDRLPPSLSGDDVVVMFGPNYFPKLFRKVPGRQLLTVNRCFVGDADDNVALGWKGFNGHAAFLPPSAYRARAFDSLGMFPDVAPWTWARGPDRRRALILGEYPSPCDDAADIGMFYRAAVGHAQELFGNDVRVDFRHHPQGGGKVPVPDGSSVVPPTKYHDPAQYGLVYTYASTYGVRCALRGLAVIADPASVVYEMVAEYERPVVNHNMSRWELCEKIASAQWNINEIAGRDGCPLGDLLKLRESL